MSQNQRFLHFIPANPSMLIVMHIRAAYADAVHLNQGSSGFGSGMGTCFTPMDNGRSRTAADIILNCGKRIHLSSQEIAYPLSLHDKLSLHKGAERIRRSFGPSARNSRVQLPVDAHAIPPGMKIRCSAIEVENNQVRLVPERSGIGENF